MTSIDDLIRAGSHKQYDLLRATIVHLEGSNHLDFVTTGQRADLDNPDHVARMVRIVENITGQVKRSTGGRQAVFGRGYRDSFALIYSKAVRERVEDILYEHLLQIEPKGPAFCRSCGSKAHSTPRFNRSGGSGWGCHCIGDRTHTDWSTRVGHRALRGVPWILYSQDDGSEIVMGRHGNVPVVEVDDA